MSRTSAPSDLQGARDVLERGGHLRIGRQVGLVEMPDEPDAQPAHAALERRRVMAGRRGGAAGIERVVAGDRSSISALSATVRVSGPTWSSVNDSGKTPRRDTRP